MTFVALRLVAGRMTRQEFLVDFVGLAQQAKDRAGDVFGGEAEHLEHFRAGAGCTVTIDADMSAVFTGIARPPNGGTGFHRDTSRAGRAEHRRAIAGILLVEQLPAWHAHDTSADIMRRQRLTRLNRQADLGARGQQHHIGIALAVDKRVRLSTARAIPMWCCWPRAPRSAWRLRRVSRWRRMMSALVS